LSAYREQDVGVHRLAEIDGQPESAGFCSRRRRRRSWPRRDRDERCPASCASGNSMPPWRSAAEQGRILPPL